LFNGGQVNREVKDIGKNNNHSCEDCEDRIFYVAFPRFHECEFTAGLRF
jgi:hypothetical protein